MIYLLFICSFITSLRGVFLSINTLKAFVNLFHGEKNIFFANVIVRFQFV